MAAVAGSFLRLTLGDLLRIVTTGVALGRQRLHRGQRVRRGALLHAALASDFRGAQAGREPGRATRRVRLTLAIDQGLDIGQQVGPRSVPRRTTTGGEGSQARETTCQRMGALTDGHPAPAAFPFRPPLSAWPELFDRPCHTEPAGATWEGASCFHAQGLEGIGAFHTGTASQ